MGRGTGGSLATPSYAHALALNPSGDPQWSLNPGLKNIDQDSYYENRLGDIINGYEDKPGKQGMDPDRTKFWQDVFKARNMGTNMTGDQKQAYDDYKAQIKADPNSITMG